MKELMEAAARAREKAYAPYSHFRVGAAVRSASGVIYDGCNVENAAYGLTNCAERTAIFKAISAGERQFAMLAVIADTDKPIAPCGACRQVIAEFRIPVIVMSNVQGDVQVVSLAELLPFAFNENDLTGGRNKNG